MPFDFNAVEITPYRLLYECKVTAGDVGAVARGILVNEVTTGVGLWADASSAYNNSPLANLLNTPVIDLPTARTAIFGDGDTTNPLIERPRCKITITGRDAGAPQANWAVDADLGVGLSAGRIVLNVVGANVINLVAYLDIHYKHTRLR